MTKHGPGKGFLTVVVVIDILKLYINSMWTFLAKIFMHGPIKSPLSKKKSHTKKAGKTLVSTLFCYKLEYIIFTN